METAIYLCAALSVGVMYLCLLLVEIRRYEASQEAARTNRQILEKLNTLVEGQRLSTILKLDPGKDAFKISPEQFEANKPAIKARLLQGLETEEHPDPDTLAYCVLDRGAYRNFVSAETASSVQKALGRLLVNGDNAATKAFLEEIVDKL